MEALWARIQAEPVLLVTFVGAVLDLAIVFGAPLADEQKTAIVVVATALLALFARSKVSPV